MLKGAENQFLSNDVAAASVHNYAAQLPQQWRQRMRSKIALSIKVSQAAAIVVAMYVSETCETSLDNGDRDLLKLKLQETDQSKTSARSCLYTFTFLLSLHFAFTNECKMK